MPSSRASKCRSSASRTPACVTRRLFLGAYDFITDEANFTLDRRTVICTVRDKLPVIFPGRNEIPKTLIFVPLKDLAMGMMMGVRDEEFP